MHPVRSRSNLVPYPSRTGPAASCSGGDSLASFYFPQIYLICQASSKLKQAHICAGMQHQQQRGMFIQTSTTPNPASLMFLPGAKVMEVARLFYTVYLDGLAVPYVLYVILFECTWTCNITGNNCHVQSGSASFDSPREGMSSPLAKRLFAIDGVSGVFFGSDFVTVTKSDDYAWNILKPQIFAAMMEHFSSGQAHIICTQFLCCIGPITAE